ncbi:response regulator transcription factor [Gammaproteobacteria bacterium AH-315-E17]|nr:response regulator transcription factor [Gammaproteobacteria bacterium AH-315-E17]
MNIVAVDDHPLFLESLVLLLNNLPFDVDVFVAKGVDEATEIVESKNGDIGLALVDLNLPGKGGVFFVRQLASEKFLIPTAIVSGEVDVEKIKKALRAGARGFIPKSLSGNDMISAIVEILDGGLYLPSFRSISASIEPLEDASFSLLTASAREENRLKLGVSRRQYDTLVLMARGLSNKDVANGLSVSEHTVKSHASVLFQLLDVRNRTECILRAKKIGLIE